MLAAPAREVRVAAAADLKFALEGIVAAFRAHHPDVAVTATFGSSGSFVAQIENGAPFDVFLSADVDGPRRLAAAGRAETPFPYAVGRIVLWALRSSPFDLKGRGIAVLRDPAVEHVAIANPKHAPYGRAARAALAKLGFLPSVEDKLVLGENVAQAAQFVESGAADLGVIARSLALAPAMADQGVLCEIPEDAYPPLEQAGVVLAGARDVVAARAFRDFLKGAEARRILGKAGFALPGK